MRYPSAGLLTIALTVMSAVMLVRTAAAQPPAPDAPAPAPKLICVRGPAETGSHFGASKICHTESEWTMIRNQSAHTMERYDTQSRQQAPAGGH